MNGRSKVREATPVFLKKLLVSEDQALQEFNQDSFDEEKGLLNARQLQDRYRSYYVRNRSLTIGFFEYCR